MLYLLSFLLSWLTGLLAILVTAFFSYDQFSIVDITSFAAITLVGFLILFLFIYLITLKMINKRINSSRQFIYFPLIFCLPANLPAYVLIWEFVGDAYGQNEATLFLLSFLTSGSVFGLFWAWKNRFVPAS